MLLLPFVVRLGFGFLASLNDWSNVALLSKQVLVQFLRQSDEVLFWINDKEAFVTAEEFGLDLEHVEVLQRKFDEFQKDMATQEYRIGEVGETADRLISEGHPETETINNKKREVFDAWARLKSLAIARQERLFGAHEIQR